MVVMCMCVTTVVSQMSLVSNILLLFSRKHRMSHQPIKPTRKMINPFSKKLANEIADLQLASVNAKSIFEETKESLLKTNDKIDIKVMEAKAKQAELQDAIEALDMLKASNQVTVTKISELIA